MFVHRQEPSLGSEDVCQSVFVWKPEIFNTHWHHVLVTVNGCQPAKLYVDSKEVRIQVARIPLKSAIPHPLMISSSRLHVLAIFTQLYLSLFDTKLVEIL